MQEGQSTTDQQTRFEKGLAVQKAICGDEVIDQLYQNSLEDQQHIQRYLSANCFGDFYTRGGLDLQQRELMTFIIIASLGGCEPQLQGAYCCQCNMGNDKKLLLAALTQILPHIRLPTDANAINCLNEVLPEK